MKFVKAEDGTNEYHFICQGCKCEGTLTIPTESQTVYCPEDCGAMYIQWNNPLTATPDLMCVVCPMFEEDEDANPNPT